MHLLDVNFTQGDSVAGAECLTISHSCTACRRSGLSPAPAFLFLNDMAKHCFAAPRRYAPKRCKTHHAIGLPGGMFRLDSSHPSSLRRHASAADSHECYGAPAMSRGRRLTEPSPLRNHNSVSQSQRSSARSHFDPGILFACPDLEVRVLWASHEAPTWRPQFSMALRSIINVPLPHPGFHHSASLIFGIRYRTTSRSFFLHTFIHLLLVNIAIHSVSISLLAGLSLFT
jgi:hypothetical protein